MSSQCFLLETKATYRHHRASAQIIIYLLTRLSKVGDGNVLETLDEKIVRVNEVPSIKQLGDGS